MDIKPLAMFLFLCLASLSAAQTQVECSNYPLTMDEQLEDEAYCKSINQMPKFSEGGAELLNYINSTINTELKNYQKEDIEECLTARYIVSFIISEKGEVKSVKMLNRAVDEYNKVDEILVRIITNLGEWEAGRCNKVAIPVLVRMPINLHFNY